MALDETRHTISAAQREELEQYLINQDRKGFYVALYV